MKTFPAIYLCTQPRIANQRKFSHPKHFRVALIRIQLASQWDRSHRRMPFDDRFVETKPNSNQEKTHVLSRQISQPSLSWPRKKKQNKTDEPFSLHETKTSFFLSLSLSVPTFRRTNPTSPRSWRCSSSTGPSWSSRRLSTCAPDGVQSWPTSSPASCLLWYVSWYFLSKCSESRPEQKS